MRRCHFWVLVLCVFSFHVSWTQDARDWRLIDYGHEIYQHGYCDQPYILVTTDGSWVCTFTTSPGSEGDRIQYIVSTCSTDQGVSWSEPVEIEPSSGDIEASWAIPLLTDFDRIYVFYTYNGDTIRALPEGETIRSDTHGWYCYRYSEDKGKSWSKRYRLEMAKTACDVENEFGGAVQMFWGIGKPVVKNKKAWFSFTKLGKYFLEEGEGWIFHSDNILTERAVDQLNWEMLPDGNVGIRNPDFGSVQEEHNIQPLNIGDGLYCAYRTTLGSPAECYSYDGGRTWSKPGLIRYASGRPIRHPRACPRIWKCANGKYLLWHHNNGSNSFANRNPAWLSGGVERNGKIVWSQPEIVLYGHDLTYETGRLSYPDLIEDRGQYWISTTQKTRATIHPIPQWFLEGLWSQLDGDHIVRNMSDVGAGMALDFWFSLDSVGERKLVELSLDQGSLTARTTAADQIEINIKAANEHITLVSDQDLLLGRDRHHVGVIFDADARIAYMIVNGSMVDGGGEKVFGFERIPEAMLGVKMRAGSTPFADQMVESLELFDHRIGTSKVVRRYEVGL